MNFSKTPPNSADGYWLKTYGSAQRLRDAKAKWNEKEVLCNPATQFSNNFDSIETDSEGGEYAVE